MENQSTIGWLLLFGGLAIAALGVVWLLAPSIPWLGRLPGDIRIESGSTRVYIPLMTCFLLSLILTLVMWLIRWFHG
jgi:hypothetical protein